MVEVRQGPYRIEKLPAIPVPLEAHPRIFSASNIITWALWLLYIAFEFALALSIQRDAPYFQWRMWAAFSAEFCLSFQELVLAFNTLLALFSARRKEPRPRYRISGQSAPSIDVLVTCCGEPVDVIVDTVTAAAAQDYPSACFRVFVLDDGHDESLRDAIEAIAPVFTKRGFAQTIYLSRTVQPGSKSYFKAGNLNFGIDETHGLGSSEYIAGLDADMIVMADWLSKMVPHLILEDKAGLAIPPQVRCISLWSRTRRGLLIHIVALLQCSSWRSPRPASRLLNVFHRPRDPE